MSVSSRRALRSTVAVISWLLPLLLLPPATATAPTAPDRAAPVRTHLLSVAAFTDEWIAGHDGALPGRRDIKRGYPKGGFKANRWAFLPVHGVGYCIVATTARSMEKSSITDARWYDSVTRRVSTVTRREARGRSDSTNACPTWTRRMREAEQDDAATDAMRSDVLNTAIAVETFLTDHPRAKSIPPMDVLARDYGLSVSADNIVLVRGDTNGYCIKATPAATPTGEALWYDSTAGGTQEPSIEPLSESCARLF
jgi:hypothetical protein